MKKWFLLLSAVMLCKADSLQYKPLLGYWFQQNNVDAYYPQALQWDLPKARLRYFDENPHWSTAAKDQYLRHPDTINLIDAHYRLGRVWELAGEREKSLVWFKSAANQDHPDAMAALARLLLDTRRWLEAETWMARLPESQRQMLQVHGMLLQGQLFAALNRLSELSGAGLNEAAEQMSRLAQQMALGQVNPAQRCDLKVAFQVDSIRALAHARQLAAHWLGDPNMVQLGVCFTDAKAIDAQASQCRARDGVAVGCKDLTAQIQHNHLPVVVLAGEGTANYDNGVIYLSDQTGYGTFRHELFHHLGFIDEYPLPPWRAAIWCKPGMRASNVKVIEPHQWPQARQQGWTKTRTCQNTAYLAIKPVSGSTNMEFMDQPMPTEYLRRAVEVLKQGL